jgi:ubiquinone/menaquinone biosynthesis C-methylase UbiE
MNSEEYTKLEQLDGTHWFYVGKRRIVRHWIDRFLKLEPSDLLVDAGMGTGTWLVEMSSQCRVLGIDDYQESLDIAIPRIEKVNGTVLKSKLDHVDLPDGIARVVTMMDVIEHLDDDAAAVREMTRITAPGGLIVITVPALMSLWSDWDVILHHRRRYGIRQFEALFDTDQLEILHCAYFNSLVLPLVWAVRFWRRLVPVRSGGQRAEERIPPWPLNAILRTIMVWPACRKWFRPPFGVSLIAVLRRKPN